MDLPDDCTLWNLNMYMIKQTQCIVQYDIQCNHSNHCGNKLFSLAGVLSFFCLSYACLDLTILTIRKSDACRNPRLWLLSNSYLKSIRICSPFLGHGKWNRFNRNLPIILRPYRLNILPLNTMFLSSFLFADYVTRSKTSLVV